MLHNFKLFAAFAHLVFSAFLWYTTYRKREGKPTKPERKIKMEFYSMEMFEMVSDWMEEVAEWEAYEADMETHPFD